MKVERMDVMAFTITDVDRLDPIRVMIENYEPGKGRITITCFGKAWTASRQRRWQKLFQFMATPKPLGSERLGLLSVFSKCHTGRSSIATRSQRR
ncbi:TPA: hypothetical protein QH000_004307 [Klebsiella pneumoniae]|nr:hypothetical protein [Klebsiella pneumoniae]